MASASDPILVTGAAGFLGAPLVRHLLDAGRTVRAVDIDPIPDDLIADGAEPFHIDIRDGRAVREVCRGVDAVIHAASIQPVSRASRRSFWQVNVGGTWNILNGAREGGARRVVYTSSSAPYGIPVQTPLDEDSPFAPICDYGRSKVAAEDLCRIFRARGLDTVVLRPRVLVGPRRLGFYHYVFNWIADHRRIFIFGDGRNRFQMLGLNDAVAACARALETSSEHRDFNIGAASFGTVREDIEALVRHAGSGSRVTSVHAGAARKALTALDRIGASPFTAWHYLTADEPFYFDIGRANAELPWHPKQSNIDALADAYDWYAANRKSVDGDLGTTHHKALRQRAFRLLKMVSM